MKLLLFFIYFTLKLVVCERSWHNDQH